MNSVTRLLTAVFLLLVFVSAIAFSYFNTQPIGLSFASWNSVELPISAWLLSAFILGGTLGLLLGFRIFRALKTRVELHRLQKELSAANAELSRLRRMSIGDLD